MPRFDAFRNHIVLLFFCLFFSSFQSLVAGNAPVISKLGVKDGLSKSEVRCIFQDHQGYMWFGTYDGLNRYNGYDFKIFRNSPTNKNSIIYSYINCIAEDRLNNLWVGTRQGISVFDPVSEKFAVKYASRMGQTKPFQIKSYIRDIKTDHAGNVFIASQDNGLILFEQQHKQGLEIPYQDQQGSLWNYYVQALFIGPNQQVYVWIDKKGLCLYDRKQKCIRLAGPVLKGVTCFFIENQQCWVGTNTGLYHLDMLTYRVNAVINEEAGLSSNRVTSLQTMPGNILWIGTDGGGINILNRASGKIDHLSDGFDDHSLSSNSVYAIYRDKDFRMWIGTLRGGINIIDNVKERFQNISHNPTNQNSLINNFVKSVFEDARHRLWIGTDGSGLSLWDREHNHFDNFHYAVHDAGTLSSNFITCIKQDFSQKIWIATYGGGIDLFEPHTRTFKKYVGYDKANKASSVVFWILYEDRLKNLWASGLQDGLFLYDRVNDRFNVFDPSAKNILAITEDDDGTLWCGTFDGLVHIDRQGKRKQYFAKGTSVRTIYEDKKGNLWLGTEAGLILFDRKQGRIVKQYTTDDGLSSNNVLTIEEDKNGYLWMSTYNGLCRLDVNKRVFTNFFESDGLQNKEFNFNASVSLKSGELAFGGINGLTLFNPQHILPVNSIPNIVINDLKVNGSLISEKPSYISAVQNSQVKALTIPYDEASLSINFSAIEFSSQEKISYRYMMENWDKGWNDIGQIRNAVYTRLNPGSYVFKVNCTDAEGKLIKKTVALNVTILPPWYRTWWAYTFYLLILFFCVYWYLSYRSREAHLKYEIKLAKVNADSQKLIQEKERELNNKRLEFFTGISHEFRTPLSLIINPINDLLKQRTGAEKNDLNIVYRNARRLLSLVDQLLLFRKADAGMSNLNIGPIDIWQVCNDVFLCFEQQAKAAGIAFELATPEVKLIIFGDREKIEIILFNLMSNAIKYSPAGKKVQVVIDDTDTEVQIQVIDNGPGIPTHIGEKLFDQFYRSREAAQPVKAGFGIGLYLAKQFTTDHQGKLTYHSLPSKGTTFILQLKKGIDHYPNEIISHIESASSPLLNELSNQPAATSVTAKPDNTDFKTETIFTDKKAILVIDDDTDLRKYIISILDSQYIVYEAENGDKGLLIAKNKLPDLIICDVMMPGTTGIELCAIIKKDPLLNYIPMILLTASSSAEGKIMGLESGADDYISKPFEKDMLVARVANLLQIRSNLQSYFYNAVTLSPGNITISEEYKLFLEKCIVVVEKHITDPDFSIKVLADQIGMSHSNLYRKVKSLSGHSVNGFIRYIRLRKAAELLIQTDMNVNQVALETGFNNIKYFRTQFHKLFGANPSDFLRQKRPLFKKKFKVIE
ncbi:response regulator [Mucilaginibacter sp. HMF5004]|uniref:hybrid sensor histidine kinase/response regulator n=1 Tax=Mucilaginibacter rivuli TaxID=2857527 RepID=UPI001C6051C5|nr:two-component regulator propeller domain-containing protein [Mucilaginibacter rivuli]MBW4889750.1 response regulator [Mucilaginibacter rivuli]